MWFSLNVLEKVGSDKKTVGCECVIATEELQTLGGLVETDIRVVSESVAAINEQIEQLESLFRNIGRTKELIKQRLYTLYKAPHLRRVYTSTTHEAVHPFLIKLLVVFQKKELRQKNFKKTRDGKKWKKLNKNRKERFGLPDFIEIEESEDDSPIEVSSKTQCKMPLMENTSKRKKVRKKVRQRKYKVIKLNEGVYKSETKTSTFKVIPLSMPSPQPSLNFRAQLLQKRTKNQRLTKMEQAGLQHKNKWFAATRSARR
ncbi:unnamed protein product [Cercopithifilaria johnstoni]|uniref:Uncharacterized protein n=1 Tax=Cercopithifilaria johnstoni TaxID=2874296 RepID=A0A8J2Q544_9BILA|nr:unnamed protein product [Cercopithifilaria johnstoni]